MAHASYNVHKWHMRHIMYTKMVSTAGRIHEGNLRNNKIAIWVEVALAQMVICGLIFSRFVKEHI